IPSLVANRPTVLTWTVSAGAAREFAEAPEHLAKKFASGDLSVAGFTKRMAFAERYVHELEASAPLDERLRAQHGALSVGPHGDDYADGRHALRFGLKLAIPWWLVSMVPVVTHLDAPPAMMIGLVANQLIGGLVYWLFAAFFFGYFFAYLRGRSGLRKGLRL